MSQYRESAKLCSLHAFFCWIAAKNRNFGFSAMKSAPVAVFALDFPEPK
jgi:hypothetical protein